MAKISELADGGNLLNDDELIVLRAGGNVRATVANLPEVDASGNQSFADNEKVTFGTGSDLQIYHNGATSLLQNNAGSLFLANYADDLDVVIQADSSLGGATDYFRADGSSGSAILYNYGSAKLATTSTGIDVTGTVVSDGLTVQGAGAKDIRVGSTDGSGAKILLDGSSNGDFLGGDYSIIQNLGTKLSIIGGTLNAPIELETHDGSSNKLRQKIASNGDVSLYEDTGTTAKFYWDASAESLGIGTASPASQLHLASTASTVTFEDTNSTNNSTNTINSYEGTMIFNVDTNDNSTVTESMRFTMRGAEAMRIDSSGNVGIGTTLPASKLHVNTGSAGYGLTIAANLQTSLTYQMGIDSSSNFAIYDSFAASQRMVIDTSGNVGIGTSSPAAPLTVMAADVSTVPAAGADSSHFAVGKNDQYGTMIGTLGSGAGYIQQQRFDGTATTYDLLVQPNGGNVGIGTSAPASLVSGGSGPILSIGGADSGLSTGEKTGALSFITNDPSFTTTYSDGVASEITSVAESAVGGAYGLAFYTGTTTNLNRDERVRITNSGNVGIGTDSPAAPLHLFNSSTASSSLSEGLTLSSNAGATNNRLPAITWDYGTAGTPTFAAIDASRASGTGGNLLFHTATTGGTLTEAMRIDSSGNLLVGKTSASSSTDGAELKDGDGVSAIIGTSNQSNAASGNVMILNRRTTDGAIVDFRKNGSAVGSIGVNSSNILQASSASAGGLFLADNGTNLVGFANSENAFRPAGDDTVDLGKTDRRFVDLYLSGGAYLGGVAAANKLDDYETGTWTPTIAGSTSGSITGFTINKAVYVKVGDLVTVGVYLANINMTTSTCSGTIQLGNLPFTANSFTGVPSVSFCNMFAFDESDVSISGYVSGTDILLHRGSGTVAITDSDESTSTAASLMFSLTYEV